MSRKQLSETLSVDEFAQLNKLSRSTVERYIRTGVLPSYKVGGTRRIRVDDAAAIQRTDADDDLDAEIKRIVDLAPKLTAAQRDTIAALFSGGA